MEDWKPRIAVYLPGEVHQNRLGPIVDIFTAGEETYIAYGALAGVVLCDRQLHYIRTLRIQEAFPSREEASIGHVQGLRCTTDKEGAKITAWSEKQAAIWKLKGEKGSTTNPSIWSSITVEQDINYVEYRENHLVIGSDEGVQVYKNKGDKDVPAWSVSQTLFVSF
ncbi:hypothetical protein QFC21_000490 [Naganishia friedmannii]|uniref:Uncharacterized protein n=1 Tax=Naganishia friedmannii TaxID=89922 RepID=A0ACC2WBZ0_9TREE|nr:hypothetical protein QFC21_000490 [Naganishia friedmannii]